MLTFISVCVGTETVPTQWTATVTLMGERAMSGEQARLVDGAALVGLTARINLACVKKRQGCNYTEMEGQRDGSLFATAWTPLLSKSENGIYLPQRQETVLPFCPFVSWRVPSLSHPTCSHTLLLWPHFLSGHLLPPINGNSTVQSFI